MRIENGRGPRVRVWDLPTRIFHWLLAMAVIGSIATAKMGDAAMVWHMRLGYVVFALLAFRLVWGVVGGRWSRFASFVRGPATVWRYARGDIRPEDQFDVGHNPLGALSVLAMLALLALQVGTGLVADDEIANVGPLNKFVASATALSATSWHKTAGQYGMILLIALHVGAIAYYLKRWNANLVRPMISGDKPLPDGTPPSRDDLVTRVAALALLAGCAAAVAFIVTLGN